MIQSKCSTCGCTGIHACIGRKPEKWTPEKIKELEDAIRLIQQNEQLRKGNVT